MKKRLISSLICSLFAVGSFSAQETQEAEKPKWKYEPNFIVGVDLLNAGVSFFSDRQLFQGFVSSRIKDNFHGIVDLGVDKNIYQNNGYDAKANGTFVKIGAFYMLARDRENDFNGFYGGGKLAGAFYTQEYMAIPVRGFGGSSSSVSMPSSSQTSFWIEGNLGGRVQLFESNFYIDVSMQPRYLLVPGKQDDVVPMIVPGFGRSSNSFTMGFAWNIAYKF